MSVKVCFIISSIGAEKSSTREAADEKFDLVFEPVLKELGYTPIRAKIAPQPSKCQRQMTLYQIPLLYNVVQQRTHQRIVYVKAKQPG